MRYVYGVLLLLFLGVVLIFAITNLESVRLRFLGWSLDMPLAALIVGAYALGMLSGWTVLGFLRRSIREVRHHDAP